MTNQRVYLTTSQLGVKIKKHPESILRANREGRLPFKPRLILSEYLWVESEVDDALDATEIKPAKKKIKSCCATQKRKAGRPTKQSQIEARQQVRSTK